MHAKVRDQQLNTWADLLLKYQKHKNEALLNVNDENSPLFYNETINRRLPVDGRLLVLQQLEKSGHASAVDKQKTQWEIYWFTLDEWANLIYGWASDNAMIGTVCTLYELGNGEDSVNQDFHQLENSVLLKALKRLEVSGKCEVISFDDQEGVKFF